VAQRVGRGIALLFHDRGTRRGWVVSSTPWLHFTPRKDLVPILQEAGWAPGPVWMGRKSRPHRDSIPDRTARSQSLYRLSYPAHTPTSTSCIWITSWRQSRHLYFFLCFVNRASLYILVNKANSVRNLFLVYLSISTCFRWLCAHHQEKQLCLCDTWYLLFCMDDCLICRVHTRQHQVSHKYSCFSLWWAHSRPKTCRDW